MVRRYWMNWFSPKTERCESEVNATVTPMMKYRLSLNLPHTELGGGY